MSFILDALKKSEAERQRQSGPTLLELRITQPRRRYPVWAVWVGVLLALNVAVLLYALLRRPAAPEPALSTASVPASGPATAAATTARPGAVPPAAVPAPAAAGAPPALSGTPSPPVPDPAAAARGVTAVAPLAPASPSLASAAPAAPPPEPAAATNPADNEPAVPAPVAAAAAAANATGGSTTQYAALPSLASLGGDLPALQLNLLDYSPLPAERFALINMHRVHEGDVLPEGPRVLAITRDGVALSFHNQDFMLRSSGSASTP